MPNGRWQMLRKTTFNLLKRITAIPTEIEHTSHPGSVRSTTASSRSIAPKTLTKAECQRIVNEFGLAMSKIGQSTMSGVIASGLAHDGSIMFDRSSLPHSPEMIREAVRELLNYEKDPINIETLHLGLMYLSYFE
jgi:hypothetical protein